VNFADFYSRREKAVFQAGTLYLDERSCDLCLRVEDAAKHGTMAALSRTYLAYCDVVRKGSGEKATIAAAFTDGDSDNLMVGRNGVFFDRKGNDWDATISKMVENPISIREAFWSPYKKVVRFVESQIEKMAAAKEKAVEASAQAKVEGAATAVAAGAPPPKKEPFDVAKFAGIFAAIGLALGAIAGAITGLVATVAKLAVWQIPLAAAAVVLAISLPSMVLAWLKLRQRNLGPLLDANGWAINAKAKINLPFGRSLTAVAKLPPGSQRDLSDPYAEKNAGRNAAFAAALVAAALVSAWWLGAFESIAWVPKRPRAEPAPAVAPAEPQAARATPGTAEPRTGE
jgi:hypothetical protein